MKSIRDFDVRGKRVLLRCDFNVPLDPKGRVLDDFRIKSALPTIEYLISKGAKLILMSHLGDPEGKRIKRLSLTPVQEKLLEYLDYSVTISPDCIGNVIEKWIQDMVPGEILLLENLRFHKGEQTNDIHFAESLARLGDIFCNDAFSVSHRLHASVARLPRLLAPSAGFLLEKEVSNLGKFLEKPSHPFIAIIGGAKTKDKLSFIEKISEKADLVLLGNLIAKEALKQKIVFRHAEKILFPLDGYPSDTTALDIGPKTRKLFAEKIKNAKSIFWTGPLGLVEDKKYAIGSLKIAHSIIKSSAFSVAGGGDLSAFLGLYNLREKFSFVSGGGGATLMFLAGERLPGLVALNYYAN